MQTQPLSQSRSSPAHRVRIEVMPITAHISVWVRFKSRPGLDCMWTQSGSNPLLFLIWKGYQRTYSLDFIFTRIICFSLETIFIIFILKDKCGKHEYLNKRKQFLKEKNKKIIIRLSWQKTDCKLRWMQDLLIFSWYWTYNYIYTWLDNMTLMNLRKEHHTLSCMFYIMLLWGHPTTVQVQSRNYIINAK